MNTIKSFTKFEWIWLVIFTMMLMITEYLWSDNLFGVICTLTGMLSVVLCAKRNKWNYLFGVISVAMYAYICYTSGYAGDFFLQFFYFPMQFVGYYIWTKHYGHQVEEEVDVEGFSKLQWIMTILICIVGTVITYGLLLHFQNATGVINPSLWLDAISTFVSIMAMILMVFRFKEQWFLWIFVDVIAVLMWLYFKDTAMIIMWSAYLVNAIYGTYVWYKKEEVEVIVVESNELPN